MLVVFSVGVAALIWDYNGAYRKNVEEITRKTYGKGKKTEELRVEGKDRVLGEIPIEVTEQVYGEQEISQVLKQVVKKMDSLILGENVSLDHVDRDLNLLTEIPGKPIDVTWKLDRYDVINIYGKLKEDKLVSEGTPVKLTAILTYREDVEKGFHHLSEYLVKCADYQDKECVQIVFLLHKETMKENYSLEQIIKECVKEEEENVLAEDKNTDLGTEEEKEGSTYFDRTEHDWIASQEMGSTILRETENLWTPMKRFLHRRRKPKWGDWDGLYIEEEDL